MNIRRVAALIVIAAACGGTATAQNDRAKIDPELARIQREVWTAFFAGDTARFKEIVPADLVAIGNDEGPFTGLREQLSASAGFKQGGGKLVDLRFTDMRVQRFGDVVNVYSRYHLVFAFGADTTRQSGRVTEVFVRRNGKWVNPAWHMDSGK